MTIEQFEKALVLTEIDSKSSLMSAFSDAFRFDIDFGSNWDALSDALIGAVEQATLVVLLESNMTDDDYDTLYDIVDQVNAKSGAYLELLVIHQPEEI